MNSTKRHLMQKELEERRQTSLLKQNFNNEVLGTKQNAQHSHFEPAENIEENKEIPANNEILTEKQLIELHLNKSLKYLNEAKSSQKSKLKFSFWEIIRSIFFPFCLSKRHKSKLKLYQRASNDLMKYINIKELVQTLQQLEKLKVVVFNKNQLALFNFLSKPLITLDGKTENNEEDESFSDLSGTKVSRIMRYMQGNNIKEQCKDIISYYNNLLETGDYSEIDKKLFELLDDDFRTIIDRFGTHRDTLFPRKKSEGRLPAQFSPS